MSAAGGSTPDPRGAQAGLLGLRIAGILAVAFGGFVLWQATGITGGGGGAQIGPRFFPLVIGVALVATGVCFAVRATAWPDRWLAHKAGDEAASTHWPTPALLAIALLAYAFALEPLGYPLATAAFLPAAARILGSRAWVRDLVVGVSLALVLYLSFTRLLGVRLPGGPLEPVLGLVG